MAQTFSQFCSEVGLPLKNERWSWCAINHERKQAVFTVWEDRLDKPARDRIDFSWLADPSRTENGAREFRRVILEVIESGYDAYGILCEAADVDARPRKRKRFEKELLLLKVSKEDDRFIARITGKVAPSVVRNDTSVVNLLHSARSAIDDLDDEPLGNVAPQRATATSSFYVRDDKVRAKVIKRAKGKCEYCGADGFQKNDGSRYLEAHHIISLAQQGPDTVKNVIALCPNHHREAHFGESWEQLESNFKSILAKLRGN